MAGTGDWQASAGNDDWTEATGAVNAPWADGAFAVFQGAAGTVTVDGSRGGVTASGMQFATDGYRVEGDAIALVGAPETVVRVGDGTAAGAGVTATIAAALTGGTRLRKTDLGTLVLSGDNTYGGGTAIDGGVVEISRDANLGAAGGALGLDGGTLRVRQDVTLARQTTLGVGGGTFAVGTGATLAQTAGIGGDGELTKAGAGTMVMTGTGAWTGGTTIRAGTLQIGDGGTGGLLIGAVHNDGALVFDLESDLDFQDYVVGTGALRQEGSGTTTFSGVNNSYTGTTTVVRGTLAAGEVDTFSAASAHVVGAEGTLDLADFDQRVAGLANAGRVTLGAGAGTRLDVDGDYVGRGGVLHFATALGGDASVTDRMVVAGDTSGTGVVEVENAGGGGGETVDGIKLIAVGGASDAVFTLAGDAVIEGRPVVIAGAYVYSLWKNGVVDPGDGDWYLRSRSTIQPGAPQVQPGVPTFEGYPLALLALNGLPTMQERVGNRYWTGSGNPAAVGGMAGDGGASGGTSDNRRAWARIEGSRVGLQPDGDLIGTADYAMDVWKLQVGVDGAVRETDDGVVIGGLTFTYGKVSTDVTAEAGDGSIDTEGYGFGGTLTWLGDDDLYVDGQAQAMWYESDLASATTGDLASGNGGFGYALGVEVGKRLAGRGDWTVTPQAQIVWSSVDFDAFTDPFDTRVSSDEGASLPLRLGVAVDQERAWKAVAGDGRRTHFYGIANLTYDFLGDTGVRVGGTKLGTDGDSLWGSVGGGGTYSWHDGTYAVYGEGLVRTSLSDFGNSYANTATFGVRMAW